MYSIEVHERIHKIVDIFHLLRMWGNEEEFSYFHLMLWKLIYLIIQVSFGLSLVLGGLLSDDKSDSVYLIGTGIAVLVIAVKLYYILWKKEMIWEFILHIGTHKIADHEEFIKVDTKVNKLMKFSLYFTVTMFASSLSTIIYSLPIFSSKKRLFFNIWFPLDWKNNTTAYWIAFAYISIGTMLNIIISLINIIIWNLMMNYAMKYQILGNQLKNIDSARGSATLTVKKRRISESENETLFLQELIGLIKTHQNIQETIYQFKNCFADLFLTQLTTSAICLCGSVYSLAFTSHDEDFNKTLMQVAVMLYNIFDIFMVMYFGNEILLSSAGLSYSLFESNWIERSQLYKTCVIILAEVLKQPHELVIGKLYPLNLKTFTSIVNAAYSMFNILQNVK